MLDGRENLRLTLGVEVNGLGITPPFKVEHPVPAPTVLIVSDQLTARVARQGCLSGSGKPKENSGAAILSFIGGAVHRQHTRFRRKQEVHRTKHALFDLSSISGAPDEHAPVGEIEHREVGLPRPVYFGICLETRGTDDVPIRLEAPDFIIGRAQKHVVGKEVGPGLFRHHTHRPSFCLLGANKCIAHVQALPIEIGHQVAVQDIGFVPIDRLIDVAPPHLVAGDFIVYDKPIERTSSCEAAGIYGEGAGRSEFAFS